MIIYKDLISGDELFSDAFPVKLVDDIVYEVDCAMVQQSNDVEVNIGANASAEGDEVQLDTDVNTVNNVVSAFGLQSTSFDKKSYKVYIRDYMKRIQKELIDKGVGTEEVEKFKKNAQAFALKVLNGDQFKQYEFYTGATMDPEGMVALLNYREDNITPYFTFWKHGVTEEKV